MREILFRGKHLINGEWLSGFLAGADHIGGWWGFDPVDHTTVGQFTGLTDKNGTKIFEGDIVTGLFLFGLEIKAVVVFQDGAFGLQWYRGDVKEFSAFTSICNITYEVVGNIHDNPELLEVTE